MPDAPESRTQSPTEIVRFDPKRLDPKTNTILGVPEPELEMAHGQILVSVEIDQFGRTL